MTKSLALFLCLLVTIPVILCKPQSLQVQQQPQISPPRPSNPVNILPVELPSEDPVPEPDTGSRLIGNHVQPGVIVHDTTMKTLDVQSEPQGNPTVVASGIGPPCPKIYRPLCASNQITYNSPCEFRHAQQNDPTLTQEKDGVC